MAISKSQARAQAAVAQLRERFPAIFTPANCRPLKIGIHNELVALGFDREMVVVGLHRIAAAAPTSPRSTKAPRGSGWTVSPRAS